MKSIFLAIIGLAVVSCGGGSTGNQEPATGSGSQTFDKLTITGHFSNPMVESPDGTTTRISGTTSNWKVEDSSATAFVAPVNFPAARAKRIWESAVAPCPVTFNVTMDDSKTIKFEISSTFKTSQEDLDCRTYNRGVLQSGFTVEFLDAPFKGGTVKDLTVILSP